MKQYAKLTKLYNIVTPCISMLKKVLKLDRVFTFGDLSVSQILEKMDALIEIVLTKNYNEMQELRQMTLISIISLSC